MGSERAAGRREARDRARLPALHAPPSPLASSEERHHLGRALLDELLLESEDALLDVPLATEVSDDDPVSALTDAARRNRANGIVVGCERHSHLQKAIGTVTSELLRASPVTVTVVPCPHAEA